MAREKSTPKLGGKTTTTTMPTKTQSACGRDSPDSLASQVKNSFDSFIVRASKITMLSTKTVSTNTRICLAERASSLPIYFEPSAPSPCATAENQLTIDRRRILHPHPQGKIRVKETILALRRAVAYVDQLQSEQAPQEATGDFRSKVSVKLSESKTIEQATARHVARGARVGRDAAHFRLGRGGAGRTAGLGARVRGALG